MPVFSQEGFNMFQLTSQPPQTILISLLAAALDEGVDADVDVDEEGDVEAGKPLPMILMNQLKMLMSQKRWLMKRPMVSILSFINFDVILEISFLFILRTNGLHFAIRTYKFWLI